MNLRKIAEMIKSIVTPPPKKLKIVGRETNFRPKIGTAPLKAGQLEDTFVLASMYTFYAMVFVNYTSIL